MSTIGRTFSVLNLVLAAVFLGWASNLLETSNDFKTKLTAEEDAHEVTRDTLTAERDKAQASANQERTQKDQYKDESDGRKADIDRLTQDLAAANDENSQLRSAVDGINNTMSEVEQRAATAVENATAAQAAANTAATERDDAQRAQQEAEEAQRNAEQALTTAEANIASQASEIAKLAGTVEKKETEITVLLERTGLNRKDIAAQDFVEGTVQRAIYDVEPGMVAINRGKNDKVKLGMTFEVYSGGTYKGRVRVTHVRDTNCSAMILSLVPGQTIAQGDSADTNLSL